MKPFQKKISAERINILRQAIHLRKELEKIVEENDHEKYLEKGIDSENPTYKKFACRDIPIVDLLTRLKDNFYLRFNGRDFVSHVKEYIDLLKQERYNEAVELNKKYTKIK